MRILAWLLIVLACALIGIWALAAMAISAAFRHGRRGWQLAVAFDRLGNVAAGGSGFETISARCWRERSAPKYARLVRAIDWVFLTFAGEENHCETSWETEQINRLHAATKDL